MKSFLTSIALLFALNPAFASEIQTVAAIETDATPGMAYLDVVQGDTGALQQLNYRPADRGPLSFTLQQLRDNWQTLKEVDGYRVVLFRLETDFNELKGGHANVRYLESGISKTYRNFRILIQIEGGKIVLRSDPNPNDPDSDENEYTSVFNYLFMKKNTFWGRLIGVSQIIPALKPSLNPAFKGWIFPRSNHSCFAPWADTEMLEWTALGVCY